MSILQKLFGRGDSPQDTPAQGAAQVAETEAYKTFELRAAPIREGKTWRVAGSVVNNQAPEQEPETFVRADTYMNYDDAVAVSLRKARQIVDEQALLAR